MAGAKVRLPTRAPTPDQIADRERWEAMTSASLSSVQAAAEKWRTGLAAFVTLITGGLLIKGPQAASDLVEGGRQLVAMIARHGVPITGNDRSMAGCKNTDQSSHGRPSPPNVRSQGPSRAALL